MHIIFLPSRSCRFLRVVLDQRDLSRIGSPNFRPAMKWRGIAFDHVYHVDIARDGNDGSTAQYVGSDGDEDGLRISTGAVALVTADRGARFGRLVSSVGSNTTLYIDLNGWEEGEGSEESTASSAVGVKFFFSSFLVFFWYF